MLADFTEGLQNFHRAPQCSRTGASRALQLPTKNKRCSRFHRNGLHKPPKGRLDYRRAQVPKCRTARHHRDFRHRNCQWMSHTRIHQAPHTQAHHPGPILQVSGKISLHPSFLSDPENFPHLLDNIHMIKAPVIHHIWAHPAVHLPRDFQRAHQRNMPPERAHQK